MPQEVFADFLEDDYRDLDPDGPVKAADLLEAAPGLPGGASRSSSGRYAAAQR